jgi:GPH family glycoside/pentoside/hexuronide:cation symporter
MVIFPLVITHFSNQFGTFGAWTWAGAIIAAVFVGAFLFSFSGMRERKEFSMVDKHMPLMASFKAALTNKTWIAYVGANLMTSCMTDWISAIAFFFVTISLGMQLGAISIMMGLEMVGTFAFFPIWRHIYLRRGTKVTLAASTITFNIVPMLGLVVHDVLGIAIMGFIAGSTIGGLVLARSIMWTDVVDEDEIKTGVRREGMYSGVASPIMQIDPIVVGTGSAFLLTSIGFVSGVAAKAQPPSVGPGIRLGMAIFTLIFTAIMLVFLKFYPLGKKKVDEVKKEIEKMHMEKAKKLEEMKA